MTMLQHKTFLILFFIGLNILHLMSQIIAGQIILKLIQEIHLVASLSWTLLNIFTSCTDLHSKPQSINSWIILWTSRKVKWWLIENNLAKCNENSLPTVEVHSSSQILPYVTNKKKFFILTIVATLIEFLEFFITMN